MRRQCADISFQGQGLTEYALILCMVSLVVLGSLALVSGSLDGTIDSIGHTLAGVTQTNDNNGNDNNGGGAQGCSSGNTDGCGNSP